MTYLLFLIPLSLAMGLIGLVAFVWALRNDQFEDPEGNSHRILIQNDTNETSNDNMATHSEDRDARKYL